LLELGAEPEARDLDKHPLSEKRLDQAVRLMAKNPNLIKRPVVVRGERMVLGFDVTAYMKLVSPAVVKSGAFS